MSRQDNVVKFDNKNKTVKDLLDFLNAEYDKGNVESIACTILNKNDVYVHWSSTDNKFEMIGAVNRLQYKLQEEL
ncbi:MAG: hypothetical protein OCD03_13200 [Hyphomicrobiales bacterium]